MPPIVVTAPLTGLLYARPEILVMTSFEREAAVAETGGLRQAAVFLLKNPERPVLEPIEYLGFHVFKPLAKALSPVSSGEPTLWKLPEEDHHLKDWFLALARLDLVEPLGDHPATACTDGRVVNIGPLAVAMTTAASFARYITQGYMALNRRRHADVVIVGGLMDEAVLDKALSETMSPSISLLVYQNPSGHRTRRRPGVNTPPECAVGLGPDGGHVRIRLERNAAEPAQEIARVGVRHLESRRWRTPVLRDLQEMELPFSKSSGISHTANYTGSELLFEELRILFETCGVRRAGYSIDEAIVDVFYSTASAAADYMAHLESKAGGDAASNHDALERAWSRLEAEAKEHLREALYTFARLLDLSFGREPEMGHPYR